MYPYVIPNFTIIKIINKTNSKIESIFLTHNGIRIDDYKLKNIKPNDVKDFGLLTNIIAEKEIDLKIYINKAKLCKVKTIEHFSSYVLRVYITKISSDGELTIEVTDKDE